MPDFECPECGREFTVRGFHSHWGHVHEGPIPEECPEPEFSEEHRENISEALEGREVSEETRRKISEAGKERFKDPAEREKAAEARRGVPMPESAKEAISEAMEREWEENREKWEDAIAGKEGNDYATGNTLTDEHKQAISDYHSGKDMPEEHRDAISEAMMGNTHGGLDFQTVEATGNTVASAWEAEFDRRLHELGATYEYEGETFDIGDGQTYTPDFIIGDLVVEVKGGIWTGWSIERAERFRDQYPEYTYMVVGNDSVPCDIHYEWRERDSALAVVRMGIGGEQFTNQVCERVV